MSQEEINDKAVLLEVTRIVDRLEADLIAYEQRLAAYHELVNSLSSAGFTNPTAYFTRPASASLATTKITAATITSATIATGSGSYSIPGWVPYLSQSEYETLKAWRDGENMIVHKLSQP
jgi:hypothetical protein